MIFTSQAASGTKIPGTGTFVDGDYITPFIDVLINEGLCNDTFLINLEEAILRTKELADQGIFVGYQGGGVLEACISGIKKYGITGNVVLIMGDSGWKNMAVLASLR